MTTLRVCTHAEDGSPAIIVPAESNPVIVSHQKLLQQALNLQKQLADLGVSPNEAVAIALPNTLEFVAVFLAISFQRAICAPLNPAYKKDEFSFYFDDLHARLVLVPKGATAQDGEVIQASKKGQVAIAEVYWNGEDVILEMKESNGIAGREHAKVMQPEEEDVALILHTSGTTGRPKAVFELISLVANFADIEQVPLTHKNLCRSMSNIQATYNLTPQDRTLLVMPLFHVHGLIAGLLTSLKSGGSVVIPARFSASEFWRDFVHHGVNWYTAVPTIHQILLRSPIPEPLPLIRFARSCSSPLSPTVHAQLESLLRAPVLEAYAMTEAAHQMTSNPLPPASRKPGSVGRPQGIKMSIMDDEGQELTGGSIGEVCIQGPNVTKGYIGDPQVTGNPFHQSGYFRTGDQGYMDKDGYLFLTGRIKELINKGGEKISPVEIDNMFAQHPKVLEAVTFAVKDDLYGQNLEVAITLREGCEVSSEELFAWFGQRAVKFKIPRQVNRSEGFGLVVANDCDCRYTSSTACPRPRRARYSARW